MNIVLRVRMNVNEINRNLIQTMRYSFCSHLFLEIPYMKLELLKKGDKVQSSLLCITGIWLKFIFGYAYDVAKLDLDLIKGVNLGVKRVIQRFAST